MFVYKNEIIVIIYYSHGDLLFVSYKTSNESEVVIPSGSSTAGTSSTLSGRIVPSVAAPIAANTVIKGAKKPWEEAEEDAVDKYWEERDGAILRKKGTDLCKCGPKAMCDYCMPLEVSFFSLFIRAAE